MPQTRISRFGDLPLWSKVIGAIALVATSGMLVWAVLDAVRGAGVSEVAIDLFIAAALFGIALTVLGIWRTGARGPAEAEDDTGHDA
jgi:hypothetical protein